MHLYSCLDFNLFLNIFKCLSFLDQNVRKTFVDEESEIMLMGRQQLYVQCITIKNQVNPHHVNAII